jgi:hypothetical protein
MMDCDGFFPLMERSGRDVSPSSLTLMYLLSFRQGPTPSTVSSHSLPLAQSRTRLFAFRSAALQSSEDSSDTAAALRLCPLFHCCSPGLSTVSPLHRARTARHGCLRVQVTLRPTLSRPVRLGTGPHVAPVLT